METGPAWTRPDRGKRTFAFSRLASKSVGRREINKLFKIDEVVGAVAYLERTQQALINAHHGTGVVELSAVVWRREQRNQLSLREELVAVLNDLVSAAYQVHVVLLEESRDDIWAESE